MFSAGLGHQGPGLDFFQNADNLFFGEIRFFT